MRVGYSWSQQPHLAVSILFPGIVKPRPIGAAKPVTPGQKFHAFPLEAALVSLRGQNSEEDRLCIRATTKKVVKQVPNGAGKHWYRRLKHSTSQSQAKIRNCGKYITTLKKTQKLVLLPGNRLWLFQIPVVIFVWFALNFYKNLLWQTTKMKGEDRLKRSWHTNIIV